NIHTKVKRLFSAVAERGGTLISQKALAEAMKLSQPAVTQLFGYAMDLEPLTQPPHRLGQLVKLFRGAGIPIEMHWLSAPLERFDRLRRERPGVDNRAPVSGPEAVRFHAKHYDGLKLERPEPKSGFRLRIEGEPDRLPIERFIIDERVQLVLVVPEPLLSK